MSVPEDSAPTAPGRRRARGWFGLILAVGASSSLLVALVIAGTDLAWRNLVPVDTAPASTLPLPDSGVPASPVADSSQSIATLVTTFVKLDAKNTLADRCSDEATNAVLIRLESVGGGGDPVAALVTYWKDVTSGERDAAVVHEAEIAAAPYNITVVPGNTTLRSQLAADLAGGHPLAPVRTLCTKEFG
jgi:hypothetical protein